MLRPDRGSLLGALSLAGVIGGALALWSGFSSPPADRDAVAAAGVDVDYYGSIRPMIVQNCLGCHGDEGPGWSMTDPEATYERHRMIAAMVTDRRMPPWLAEPGHQSYVGDMSLPVEAVEMMRRWRDADFPKGAPRPDDAIQAGGAGGGHGAHGHGSPFVPQVALDVLPGGRFLPNQAASDDYRCFVVDWTDTAPRYITGFRAVPGNERVAHHVVIHAVDPELRDRFRELEDAEEGPGYQCFGGGLPDRLGIRAEREAYEARYPNGVRELNLGHFWLAHWAPGMDGHVFPEDTGILLEPGAALVVQMHYYASMAPGEADEGTRVEFQVADAVERPAFHFSQTRGDWLVAERNRTMVIEPGATATWEVRDGLEELLPYISRVTQVPVDQIGALEIHSANLHMHGFGHAGEISFTHPSGQKEILLSVPRWDLRWQRDFTFVEPKIFPRSALRRVTLTTECTFRNPTDDVVYGGYGSDDEMCFNFSYIAVQRTADAGPPQ